MRVRDLCNGQRCASAGKNLPYDIIVVGVLVGRVAAEVLLG